MIARLDHDWFLLIIIANIGTFRNHAPVGLHRWHLRSLSSTCVHHWGFFRNSWPTRRLTCVHYCLLSLSVLLLLLQNSPGCERCYVSLLIQLKVLDRRSAHGLLGQGLTIGDRSIGRDGFHRMVWVLGRVERATKIWWLTVLSSADMKRRWRSLLEDLANVDFYDAEFFVLGCPCVVNRSSHSVCVCWFLLAISIWGPVWTVGSRRCALATSDSCLTVFEDLIELFDL